MAIQYGISSEDVGRDWESASGCADDRVADEQPDGVADNGCSWPQQCNNREHGIIRGDECDDRDI